MEQYVDFNAQTTVGAGGYTSGSGILNVASTAAPFPQAPTFSVVIQDQSTGAVKVILRVLSIASGTRWTVVAEGTDGNAAAGDNVYAVLSALSIDQIRQDIVQKGAIGSRSVAKAGNLYLATDVPILGRDNGSTFDNFGPLYNLTDPTTPAWVWVNQSTGSIAQNGPSLFLTGVASAGNNAQIRKYAAPATPYTITALVVPNLQYVAFGVCGLLWREAASGKFTSAPEIIYSSTPAKFVMGCEKWTNETTFNSSYSVPSISVGMGPIWLRMRDDGTNRIVSYSFDGINFVQFFSVLRTDFLTPTEVGFFVNSNQSNQVPYMSVLSWQQTAG